MTDAKDFVVIGAGLMRTGTHSLRVALEKLLDAKCYHMVYVIQNPQHINFWMNACKKTPSDHEWRDFFSDFRAAVDFPDSAFYKELMQVYPNAKVVLSVRDAHSWFKSVYNTIRPRLKDRKESTEDLGPMKDFVKMNALIMKRCFDEDFELDFLENEEKMVAAFDRYTEEVKRVVPPERLLVFEAKDGWEPLCKFLSLPVPDEPYPVTNTTEEFQTRAKDNSLER